MTTLNLDQIATFVAIVRTRNFRVAARERGKSQGAVSQQLRKLEATLGVQLIERNAKHCQPTTDGVTFLSHAESLLRLSTRAIKALCDPRITIGASSNIGIYLLQPYINTYFTGSAERHSPLIQIHQNPLVAHLLEAGEIDVAMMEWWDARPGYVAHLWRREELVVIVPPGHPWTEMTCVPLTAFSGVPLLGGEPGTGTGRILARVFGEEFAGLQTSMRLGSTEAVKQWVKAGHGVSIVLASTVEEACRAGALVALPLEGDPPTKDLYVIWRETLAASHPARAFGEWLTTQLDKQQR